MPSTSRQRSGHPSFLLHVQCPGEPLQCTHFSMCGYWRPNCHRPQIHVVRFKLVKHMGPLVERFGSMLACTSATATRLAQTSWQDSSISRDEEGHLLYYEDASSTHAEYSHRNNGFDMDRLRLIPPGKPPMWQGYIHISVLRTQYNADMFHGAPGTWCQGRTHGFDSPLHDSCRRKSDILPMASRYSSHLITVEQSTPLAFSPC
jgi:hypothetical protein